MGIRVPKHADRRDAEGRPAGRARRAHHRQRQPVLHLPRRARPATAAGPCLAGCRTRSAASGAPTSASPPSPPPSSARCWRAARRRVRRSARGWVAGLQRHPRELMAPEWDSTADGVNFAAVCVEIDKHLADDAAVTSDAGNFSTFIHRYIGFKPGQMFLVLGRRRDGRRRADGRRRRLRRPGKQAVAFVRRRRRADDAATRSPPRMQYGVNPILIISDNKLLRHHRHAPRHALPGPALSRPRCS